MWMFRFADTSPAAVPVPPEEHADDGVVREEIQNALINVLPWGISAVFHAALVLLAVFVVWTTILRVPDEPVIVPLVNLSATPASPLQMEEIEKLQERPTDRRTVEKKTESRVNNPLQTKLEVKVPIIGVTGAASAKAVPFGATLDAGSQFKSSMFGLGGNARRLVFVIDATGSLIDTFPFIIAELKRTIQELSEQQSFAVVFFTGDGMIEAPPGLHPATSEVKARVIEWIDPSSHNVIPTGKSNPVEAIQRALRYKPELIFLLSDNITGRGHYEIDQKALLNEIGRANTGNTKINTIQFIYRDPFENVGLPGTMKLIADQSGGLHTFISAEDLGLR